MSTCRDWLRTLFPSSYKGVPFYVEKDEEEGGRRLVVHQFPMRDDPFVEDLGEEKRAYSLTAYVASDSADSQASAVQRVCTMRGAGVLVLPTHGPIVVQCESFKRSREKDKHGYIALELKFVRDGARGALATVSSLVQLVFDAAAAMSAIAGQVLGAVALVRGLADTVAATAITSAQNATAALEALRTDNAVEPAASSASRDALAGVYQAAAFAFARRDSDDDALVGFLASPAGVASVELAPEPTAVEGWGAALVEAARQIGDGMAPDVASAAFRAIVADAPATALTMGTPTAKQSSANALEVERTLRLAALTVMAEAAVRQDYPSRQAAIAARAEIAEMFEREEGTMTGAVYAPLYVAVEALRGAVVTALSRRIIDLAPIVTVEARIAMPSLWWAWRLHQDPVRATELVGGNSVVHPSFMPLAFEALSDRPTAR